VPVRLVQFSIQPEDKTPGGAPSSNLLIDLHIVLFPADAWPFAKLFWQHTGMGISSRVADRCLSILTANEAVRSPPTSPVIPRQPFKAKNRHYAAKSSQATTTPGPLTSVGPAKTEEAFTSDETTYLEERYGRNMPLSYAAAAKRALRRRIAGVLVHDKVYDSPSGPYAGGDDVELGPSTRGVQNVSEDDVFLFPTGMTAIWHAHQLSLATMPCAKSICFGSAQLPF
jgi:cystathionine gamma-synthase